MLVRVEDSKRPDESKWFDMLTWHRKAGKNETFSACAFHLPEAGFAWLYTHERPWDRPIVLTVRDYPALYAAALEHGQVLAADGFDAAGEPHPFLLPASN
jgi:hypothetical protein